MCCALALNSSIIRHLYGTSGACVALEAWLGNRWGDLKVEFESDWWVVVVRFFRFVRATRAGWHHRSIVGASLPIIFFIAIFWRSSFLGNLL